MRITDLALHRFRNYDDATIGPFGDLVIFHGPNAVGKTNLLEAIHLLTATTSFRHPQISQLIEQGSTTGRIQLNMTDGNRQLQVALTLEPGKKKFQVNGKAKSSSEVRGILPAITFVPDDLDIAKKSSSVRRNVLDDLGVQLSKNYDVVQRDYEKALRYKNRLLKYESSQVLIDAINETLLAVGAQLYCYRRALYERMIPFVADNYQAIAQSGEQFHAEYLPSWLRMQDRFPHLSSIGQESAQTQEREEIKTYIYDALQAFNCEETRARRSFIGPHNDQITFFLSGNDASTYASQGQQRSIVLAWKLAEVQLVRQMLGVEPVLLLDDVMSELDESRRDLLVQAVGTEVQTFITSTDLTPFNRDLLSRAHLISLPLEA